MVLLAILVATGLTLAAVHPYGHEVVEIGSDCDLCALARVADDDALLHISSSLDVARIALTVRPVVPRLFAPRWVVRLPRAPPFQVPSFGM